MHNNCTTEEIPNIVDNKEIEVLTVALIEALKHQKSKCCKDEASKLVKDIIQENITREFFAKSLDSLIKSDSARCSLISNRIFLFSQKT